MTPEEVREALATHLMGQGIYVTDCERRESTLHVGYETVTPGDGVPRQEIGQVVNLLLDLAGIEGEERETRDVDAAGAWDPEDVHVWVFEEPSSDDDGTGSGDDGAGDDGAGDDESDDRGADRVQRGDWELRGRWLTAYDEGYLSETDLSTLVLSTL